MMELDNTPSRREMILREIQKTSKSYSLFKAVLPFILLGLTVVNIISSLINTTLFKITFGSSLLYLIYYITLMVIVIKQINDKQRQLLKID
jgi:Mg2+/Co2+ transporter CorB